MRYYTEEHEWVEVIDDEATIGISEYAAEQLGEISFVEFPEEDDCFNIGDRLGEIESEKTSCDIYSPISGTVCAVNEHLADAPDLILPDSLRPHGLQPTSLLCPRDFPGKDTGVYNVIKNIAWGPQLRGESALGPPV